MNACKSPGIAQRSSTRQPVFDSVLRARRKGFGSEDEMNGGQQAALEREEEEEEARKKTEGYHKSTLIHSLWNKTLKNVLYPENAEKIPDEHSSLKNVVRGETFQDYKDDIKRWPFALPRGTKAEIAYSHKKKGDREVGAHAKKVKIINRQHDLRSDLYIYLLGACWVTTTYVVIGSLLVLAGTFFLFYLWDLDGLEGHNGSYLAVFLFSLSQSTLSGNSPVSTVSHFSVLVGTLHGLISQLYFVVLTGIFFTRLSLPKAGLKAGDKMIINLHSTQYEERPVHFFQSSPLPTISQPNNSPDTAQTPPNPATATLPPPPAPPENPEKPPPRQYGSVLLRVINTRLPPIMVDVSFFLTFGHPVHTSDGGVIMKMDELPLVRPHAPFWLYTMLIRHIINEDSPLWGYTRERLYAENASFYLSILGTEKSSMQSVVFHHSYSLAENEVAFDAKFVDLMSACPDGNGIILDHGKLDEMLPHIPTSLGERTVPKAKSGENGDGNRDIPNVSVNGDDGLGEDLPTRRGPGMKKTVQRESENELLGGNYAVGPC